MTAPNARRLVYSAHDAVEVLNRIHAADPSVLPALISYRVPCNDALADDPTVQVGPTPESDGANVVGLLGIVNGLFGTRSRMGPGFIGAHFTADGELQGFAVLS